MTRTVDGGGVDKQAFATAAANTQVQVVLAAPSDTTEKRAVTRIDVDYSGTPDAGSQLVVTSDGATIYTATITTAGTTALPFWKDSLCGTTGKDLTMTLDAGGTGVVGCIWYSEDP